MPHLILVNPRETYEYNHILVSIFGHVLVIFNHKYNLSDRAILWAVDQPNFFVAKKSTLNGVRLLIISWQGP